MGSTFIDDYGPCTLKSVPYILQAGSSRIRLTFLYAHIKLGSGRTVPMLVITGRKYLWFCLFFWQILNLFFIFCFRIKYFQGAMYLMVFLTKLFSKRTGDFFFLPKNIFVNITTLLFNSL